MLNGRISPKDIDLLIRDASGPAQVAEFARGALRDVLAHNTAALGAEPPFQTFVDGRQGAVLESVRVPGEIAFIFEIRAGVLQWIYDQLLIHSPVLKGQYKKSIRVYADGSEIQDLSAVGKDVEEVVFLPTVPYARKIERGQSAAAPQGVVEVVADLAKAKYGAAAKIRFIYADPQGGGTLIEQWAAGASVRRGHTRRVQRTRILRNPAISVRLK